MRWQKRAQKAVANLTGTMNILKITNKNKEYFILRNQQFVHLCSHAQVELAHQLKSAETTDIKALWTK